ncbi:hypothetical protein HDV57DRAFT_240173 [Trichoderma longibrachiatum]|uniref:Uncharacterized protein n=1 Tax=Trichoderma longibrachiatum ATCC 18648 TaxID=983965 RepID=A0A2T4BZT3_TRILO|nr:hypothetical protein M440DRAFT_1036130 [Trichoderma longibrachiatum ATCC 18648]
MAWRRGTGGRGEEEVLEGEREGLKSGVCVVVYACVGSGKHTQPVTAGQERVCLLPARVVGRRHPRRRWPVASVPGSTGSTSSDWMCLLDCTAPPSTRRLWFGVLTTSSTTSPVWLMDAGHTLGIEFQPHASRRLRRRALTSCEAPSGPSGLQQPVWCLSRAHSGHRRNPKSLSGDP